tara:strand:- start:94 stop:1572 length:1479 start_codon:yes stop_codon:yes gene_type:complete
MYKPLILIVLLLSSSFAVLDVSSIDDTIEETNEEKPRPLAINYIPFKESATIAIDQKNDKITVFYSLMSKDKKDFQIPDSFETKILNKEQIATIVYTNAESCAVGVYNKTCILINIPINEIDVVDYKEKQKAVREIGDSIIDDINQVFGANAEYHSVVAQTSYDLTDEEGPVLSAIYTMQRLPAKILYNFFILENITEEIRFAGGFFNHAKLMSHDENAVFTFFMTPEEKRILYSLRISVTSLGNIGLNNLSPLDFLGEDKLDRSKLFAEGFFPLSSIVRVMILSEGGLQVTKVNSEIITSMSAEELQKNGWHIISNEPYSDDETQVLDLRYLFGRTNSVDRQELVLTIIPVVEDVTPNDVTPSDVSQNGGGCLIATAAFGSEMTPQVQFLRELRDNTVLQTESGTSFMTGFNQFYYSFSPAIADYERENPAFKETVKLALTPLLTSLTLLQYADIDSESKMLGYGIGIILLNIGMYFVAPAVLVMKIRKLV